MPTCRPRGAAVRRSRIAFTNSSMTWRQSPTIGTSGRRTLPCSAGSMSTWMTLASGANVDLAGDAVVEAGAEGDQQVAPLHRSDRRGVAVHAWHAEGERMVVGEHAARHQRGDDVDVGQLGELAQRLGGTRLEHAAADVEHRPLRLHDQPGRLADHSRVALGGRPVAGQRGGDLVVARPVPLHLLLQDVLGHVDQGRSGTTGGGDVERLADRHRELLGRHDQLVVLGAERVMPTVSHSWKASVPIAGVLT